MPTPDLKTMRLGYAVVTTPAPSVYLGGAMVTDGRGLPIEFRYTEPIEPTRLQQLLYGQVLSQYLKTEVILDTLWRSVESQVDTLLVADDALLSAPLPLTRLRLAEARANALGNPGTQETLSPHECLLQVSRDMSPIRVAWPEDLPGLPDELTDILLAAGEAMDLLEPLRRIDKALELIAQEAGFTTRTPA